MNKRGLLVVLLLVVTAIGVSAQRSFIPKPVDACGYFGDITPLKGQKEMNLVLDISGTWVDGSTEDAYIAEKTKDKTEEEKEKFLKEWNEYLQEKAYTEFVIHFNKEMEKVGMSVNKIPNAKYTMYIQVKEIYTGWYAGGVGMRLAEVVADIKFLKTGENTPFATIIGQYSWGGGTIYTAAWYIDRIAKAFGPLGNHIGKNIVAFTPSSQTVISICNMEVMSYDFVASWERSKLVCPEGWRLPTSEELRCMCNEKKMKRKDSPLELKQSQYWTSDEVTKKPNKAVSRTTNDCKEEIEDKEKILHIRYVRK